MVSKLLKSNGVRQLLGAVGGMTVAAALYYGMNMLPFSKALLIGSNPTIVQNGKQVNINEKNVDPDTLKRIAARATQVAATLQADQSGSSSSEAVVENQPAQSAVVDHADAGAWLAMRATQKAMNEMHTAPSPEPMAAVMAPSAAASSSLSSSASSSSTSNMAEPVMAYQAPTVVDTVAMPTVPSKRLPNSGLGLDLLMFVSFVLAVAMLPEERKRALIAALRFEH